MSNIKVSIETFPIRNLENVEPFFEMLHHFQSFDPDFISVTYGASGSDAQRSERLLDLLIEKAPTLLKDGKIVPHLTCSGRDKSGLEQLIKYWWQRGIRHIVALRGDAAPENEGQDRFFQDSTALIQLITSIAPFDISVAGYPEIHPKSVSQAAELNHLKRKIEAGATRVLTQFFFDPDVFLRYRDLCQKFDIQVEIIPGILPIVSLEQTQRFAQQCGASIPKDIVSLFSNAEKGSDEYFSYTVHSTVKLMERLRQEGVDNFHFYSLNKRKMTEEILNGIGIRSHDQNVEKLAPAIQKANHLNSNFLKIA